MFMTGLRISEAQALQWDKDIDFVEKHLLQINQCTAKTHMNFILKSQKQRQVIEYDMYPLYWTPSKEGIFHALQS